MTTTKCPYCAEEIQSEAIKCKHCGCWLTGHPDTPPAAPGGEVVAAPRLLRSSSDRMIAGVCGGLARYLAIDPTIVRVLTALVTFFTGIIPGVVTYLILAFVVPRDDSPAY